MEALSKQLFSCVSVAIDEFATKLASELGVDKSKVLDVWNSQVSQEVKVSAGVAKEAPAKKPSSKAKSAPKGSADKKTCQYTYVKGAKEGEMCGAKVSDESSSGQFCKKHMGHEISKDEKKEPKKAPAKKSGGGKKSEAKEEETPAVSGLKASMPPVSIKINEFRQYQHEGTKLLFDRKTEEVYGKADGKGGVIPLTTEDIASCKQFGFRFRVPEKLTSEKDKDSDEEELHDSDDDDDDDDDDDEDEDDDEDDVRK